ncbi:MAG TPA: hypothetical protein VGS02_17840 [Acidobacteriaceae bacterium]|nr:hypothetical protein [Acidobacteriaceae bacterium]
MHEQEQLWHDVRKQLIPLGAVFDRGESASKYRDWFRETLDQNELELALHAVCEFLIENPNATLKTAELDRIRVAHELMSLEDDCIRKLVERDAITPN